jgi:hypothetical protein
MITKKKRMKMPKVGKKEFAYTPKGMAMAKMEAKKTGAKMVTKKAAVKKPSVKKPVTKKK